MLEPWNSKFIQQPPIHTSISSKKIDINNLRYTCKNIITTLSKQSPLHNESALLSRFLYKYDKKFRSDIGYKRFKKVNTALRKYLTLDLIKDVTSFYYSLPSSDNNYLPTKQMLEYILVRLMTFSKLMLRINICSKQAAIFYLNRIKNGDSHWMSFMPYALLCRIWSFALVLLQHSCNWYDSLLPFLKHLELKGLNFLPDGYKLPESLADWIDLKHINDEGRFNWAQKLTRIDFNLIEKEDNDFCENILQYVNNINTETTCDNDMEVITQKQEINITSNNMFRSYDTGVAISRDSFKCLETKESSINTGDDNKIMNKCHSIKNVTNIGTLNKFLNYEETYRNNSNALAITSHLSFMQWQALKKSLLKLNSNFSSDIKLQKKVQIVWKEKCLDYM